MKLRFKSRRWTRGFDQEVEEEHLTLLDGRRFETKNYACDALPARRRKPLERLVAADSWQNGEKSGLAHSGKKTRPKRERLTCEAIEDLILYSCKEFKSWWVACDKDPETGISRLAGQDRDDYFYRSFGTGELEDLKWGQGKRVKKGIRIVRSILEGREQFAERDRTAFISTHSFIEECLKHIVSTTLQYGIGEMKFMVIVFSLPAKFEIHVPFIFHILILNAIKQMRRLVMKNLPSHSNETSTSRKIEIFCL